MLHVSVEIRGIYLPQLAMYMSILVATASRLHRLGTALSTSTAAAPDLPM